MFLDAGRYTVENDNDPTLGNITEEKESDPEEFIDYAKIDENGILQEDILVRSPSYAGAFVIGGHVNGMVEWKTKEGVSLKEVENS